MLQIPCNQAQSAALTQARWPCLQQDVEAATGSVFGLQQLAALEGETLPRGRVLRCAIRQQSPGVVGQQAVLWGDNIPALCQGCLRSPLSFSFARQRCWLHCTG